MIMELRMLRMLLGLDIGVAAHLQAGRKTLPASNYPR
jgi:hypothetical protein